MPEPLSERSFSRLAWSLVGLALLLRLPGIFDSWPNPDEGFYLRFANAPSWESFLPQILRTPHPPGFFLLQRLIGFVSGDVVALRLLSVASGALAVHAMARLGREVGGAATGLVAASLLCLAPGAIALSQVARPYAFLTATLTHALAALLLHLRSGSLGALHLHVAALAVAMLTHYGAFLPAFACGCTLLATGFGERAERELRWARLRAAAAFAILALLLLVFHLRGYVLGGSMQRSARDGWLEPFFVDGPIDFWLGLIGTQRFLLGERYEALAVLSLVAGVSLLLLRREARDARRLAFVAVSALTLGLWGLASAVGQYPWGSTRHSFFANALLIPLMARPWGWAIERGLAGVAAALAAAGLVLSFPTLPRAIVGASSLATRASVEWVGTHDEILPHVEALQRLREQPVQILMDRETWNLLAPVWIDAGIHPERRETLFRYAYAWGSARVAATTAWNLRAPDGSFEHPAHLARALASDRLGAPSPEGAAPRELWLFLGGWHAMDRDALERHDGWLAEGGPPGIGAFQTTRPMLHARVERGAYLERVARKRAESRLPRSAPR